mmetsp:Transcript_196/g.283  ORF Transcript_196/g.283 Transcript_196/m.283 type:complete len:269 (+) Transcript_196:166-972(+)
MVEDYFAGLLSNNEEIVQVIGKVVAPSVVGGLTALAVSWRARRAWLQRQFFSRLNISLTTLSKEGKLCLRTLKETELLNIMPNTYGVELLTRQARLHEAQDKPKLVAASAEFAQLTQTALMNAVSELSSSAYIARDLGRPTMCAPYSFGLVFEDGQAGGYKLRLVVASLSTLRNAFIFSQNESSIQYEAKMHDRRFRTLLLMHQALSDRGLNLSSSKAAAIGGYHSTEKIDFASAVTQITISNDAAKTKNKEEDEEEVPILGLLELCC